mmetsp:Transcript_3699/g.5617  ORF Transcript_3699/g.5617 Transcript_3699/m.5617 type:complete len:140 (-) Transcript_3699:98-517(-)
MERKLKQDFRKFRNEFYKWEAYFARPRSKYYTKETAEFDKMVSDALQIQKGEQRDKIKAQLNAGKKILLVDCFVFIEYKEKVKQKFWPFSFKFHLSSVSYKGKLEQQYDDFLCVIRHIAESCLGKSPQHHLSLCHGSIW